MDQANVTGIETGNLTVVEDQEWLPDWVYKLRTSVLLLIVIMAVLGNMLVIVSVMRHRSEEFILVTLIHTNYRYFIRQCS